mmetsp:Transcript_23775/g.81668  ORF Transcript_23775/g.81668 Transcript_23775/m.81668 type:complete len:241 (+) Transcript_23775:60-782(+)
MIQCERSARARSGKKTFTLREIIARWPRSANSGSLVQKSAETGGKPAAREVGNVAPFSRPGRDGAAREEVAVREERPRQGVLGLGAAAEAVEVPEPDAAVAVLREQALAAAVLVRLEDALVRRAPGRDGPPRAQAPELRHAARVARRHELLVAGRDEAHAADGREVAPQRELRLRRGVVEALDVLVARHRCCCCLCSCGSSCCLSCVRLGSQRRSAVRADTHALAASPTVECTVHYNRAP